MNQLILIGLIIIIIGWIVIYPVDSAVHPLMNNWGWVYMPFKLKNSRFVCNEVQYQSGKCTFQLGTENVFFFFSL